MGCFDVACGISSITIKRGEDALLLLLVPFSRSASPEYLSREVELKPGLQQVFNEGPLGLYMPFCLPIRGEYNDYGSLEKIKNDETVKELTKYFGATFEQIIDVIHRAEYGTLHDPEMLAIYGNELEVNRYGDKKITKAWLLKAGFVETDGVYNHPDVPKIIKWNKTEDKIIKTDEPKTYVVIKEVKKQNKNDDSPKEIFPHIIYWENDKWNETYARDQFDFCQYFLDKTKPMGWFSSGEGIVLGMKPECIDKAKLLSKLSGMFIDGKVYDQLTNDVKTNQYYNEGNGNILTGYMNRFLMDAMGFDFVKTIDQKTNKDVIDEGFRLGYRSENFRRMYSHKNTPGYMYGINLSRSMATDMYSVKDDKLKEIPTYSKNKSYHPFSPKGLAEMIEGETGYKIDLSLLKDLKPFDLVLLKIQDFLTRCENTQRKAKEYKNELEKFLKDNNLKQGETGTKEQEATRMELFNKYYKMDNRSDTREQDADMLGSFNFPLFHEMYAKHFMKPSKHFKEECSKFKNMMTSLWGINRLLMPSTHFGQHGDYINQLEFNNIIRIALKQKMTEGYHSEYESSEELDRVLELLYNSELSATTKDDEVTYMHRGQEVAVWNIKNEYGYLITEKGR